MLSKYFDILKDYALEIRSFLKKNQSENTLVTDKTAIEGRIEIREKSSRQYFFQMLQRDST